MLTSCAKAALDLIIIIIIIIIMEERKKFRCTKFLIRKSLNNGDYLLYFVFQRFLSGWDGTGSWLEVSSVFAAHPSAETEHYM